MSILYKPVLIESVEQAEKLSIGTIATRTIGGRVETLVREDLASGIRWRLDAGGFSHLGAVGWTALVPIEAEEEHRSAHWMDAYYPNAPKRIQTRYVTPWEAA